MPDPTPPVVAVSAANEREKIAALVCVQIVGAIRGGGSNIRDVEKWVRDRADTYARHSPALAAQSAALAEAEARLAALGPDGLHRNDADRFPCGHHPCHQADLTPYGGEKVCVSCERDTAEAALAERTRERDEARVNLDWALDNCLRRIGLSGRFVYWGAVEQDDVELMVLRDGTVEERRASLHDAITRTRRAALSGAGPTTPET